ncbi:MAG: hypothetical protein R2746_15185 [Acidimicrobiales bacterium]|nr:hypothetical protein [Actinomycetota bacterium]
MSTDPEPTPEEAAAADAERLDDIHDRVEQLRERAEDDLEPGGEGRMFADAGVRTQVEEEGDTEHPLADR